MCCACCRYEFIRGKRHPFDPRSKQDAVAQLTMAPPSDATYTLGDIAWDESTLRLMLRQTMDRHGL